MKYISTRGGAPAVGFTEALLAGLAPDGGLYAPQTWPVLTPDEIAAFAGAPYAQVAADILGRFAGDEIAPEVMAHITEEAYATFRHAAVTPLRQLAHGRFLLELFHGPTLAFKDVAMQLLARLYEHALAARGRDHDHRLRHLRRHRRGGGGGVPGPRQYPHRRPLSGGPHLRGPAALHDHRRGG